MNASKIIIFCLIIVGTVFLEIFLSKKENKWLGLILPIITFSFSVLIAFFMLFSFIAGAPFWVVFMGVFLSFLFWNIPTIILYITYKACREKSKKIQN